MKKYIVLLLIFLIPFLVGAQNCNSADLEIISIQLNNIQGAAKENKTPTINNNNIDFDVNMFEVNDSAEYKLTVKNQSEMTYYFNKNSDNGSKYIKIDYEVEDDKIEAGQEKEIMINLTYKNEVPNEELVNGIYNDNSTITLQITNDKIEVKDTLKTIDTLDILLICILVVLITIGVIALLLNNKKKNNILLIFGLVLLIPYTAKALCNYELNINSNVAIIKRICPTFLTNTDSLNVADELAFDTEHFYILKTDDSETALLSKYNLYVGVILDYKVSTSTWSGKVLDENDEGYGLQNSSARGYYESASNRDKRYVGVVPFSGTNYWDESVAECIENNCTVSGTGALKPEYDTYNMGRYEFATGGWYLPNIYDDKLSSIAPEYYISGGTVYAQNNGYTIAYFVHNYVNTLSKMGVSNIKSGRLLYNRDSISDNLRNKIVGSFWVGTSAGSYKVNARRLGVGIGIPGPDCYSTSFGYGVKPVIIVDTSYLNSCME